ncbi:MAG: threonine synthase [Candidatus Micrarchaeota archaeon]|nr:threonine synthase [Candidatus Micrarchaeota archaeon]
MDYRISCAKCGRRQPETAFRCASCGSILEVSYRGRGKLLRQDRGKPISRYLDFLPIGNLYVELGEGGTPLKRISSGEFKDIGLFLKLETGNPTMTFKDRGSAVEISKAVELKMRAVCCASTGNMGLSVAHYARQAGMRCTIFISKDANAKKIEKIRRQGARIVEVKGDFNKALNEAEAFARKTGAFLCGDYHFRKEGQKTLGFEVVEQSGKEMPDYVFMPVGNATLFSGVYKGLTEFKKAGLVEQIPRLVAVQSEKCDPLVSAWLKKKKLSYVRPRTEADAIAVGYPTFGFEGIEAIRKSKGDAVAVAEKEIEDAVMGLERFGVYAELGGGTGFAGFLKYYRENPAKLKGKRVVVVVTGNNEGVFREQ